MITTSEHKRENTPMVNIEGIERYEVGSDIGLQATADDGRVFVYQKEVDATTAEGIIDWAARYNRLIDMDNWKCIWTPEVEYAA